MAIILQGQTRLSFMEVLLGFVAALSDELRRRSPGEPASMRPAWLFESLDKLSQHEPFAESLQSLEEGSFIDVLSQMKTWRSVDVEDGGRGIIMNPGQSARQLTNIGRKHGVTIIETLQRLAAVMLNFPPTP